MASLYISCKFVQSHDCQFSHYSFVVKWITFSPVCWWMKVSKTYIFLMQGNLQINWVWGTLVWSRRGLGMRLRLGEGIWGLGIIEHPPSPDQALDYVYSLECLYCLATLHDDVQMMWLHSPYVQPSHLDLNYTASSIIHQPKLNFSEQSEQAFKAVGLNIQEFRCYEAKIEESEKGQQLPESRTQDTSGLSRQCSVTELRQPDNHQPSQSFICTAQVVLNASVVHLATTQYVPSELH